MPKKEKISERLKIALETRKISQKELADKTGINKSAINMYVHDVNCPRNDKLFLLSEALEVNEAWLMGYEVPMDKPNFSISGNGNNSSQSNNNSGMITTITNNYSDCNSNIKQKNHQEESVHQKNIETLYAIIDELKKMSDEDMQQVLRYACLLNK